jgi:hypothetical protein
MAPTKSNAYAGASATVARRRPTVRVRKETRIAAPATPTPPQTPEMLSSQPIERSIEKRPGPIAASETAYAAIRILNS